MPIRPGQNLLHYRLVDKLGEGGMGVVWRVRDTTLDREVAIKILPDAFARDADRLARFEREARLLASLNHPNIAAVYGLHQAEVSDDADDSPAAAEQSSIRFIAMELVGGPDLSQRLTQGPLPVDEALAVAAQIAEGLSAAHAAGVIHRDLKPANVKRTPDGKVKVLDFGLAKGEERAPAGGADPALSPTMTSAGTVAGVILGTAGYMAPEQARGRPVDKRADVWAFGAVLFEMLSGRRAFPGETVSEVIAKIIEREPPWSELPAGLHPGVTRILRRCLAKDPDERLHDVADARLEIQEAIADPTGGAEVANVTATTRRAGGWKRALPWALAAILGAWLAVALVSRSTPTPPLVQFDILAPSGHEFGEFSVSPDGSAVVFVTNNREGARNLWIRHLDSTDVRLLPGTEGAMFPFWSPDNGSVGFFGREKLRRIDLASGSVQTVADAPNGRGGDWNADGLILFTPEGEDVLYTVPASGGTPSAVTRLGEDVVSHRFPHFLPDGRRFTFSAHGTDSTLTHRFIGSLDGDAPLPLPDGMSETYAPPGYLLLIREGTLFAQPFASDRLVGEPAPLANEINDVFPRTARSAFSVSDNGVLAFLQRTRVDSRFEWRARDGRRLETIAPADAYAEPRLSPDGRRIVFLRSDPSSRSTPVSVLDLARGASNLLTGSDSVSVSPAWSHDGDSVIYGAPGRILRQDERGGSPEVLLDTETVGDGAQLSAVRDIVEATDGSFVVFSAWDPVTDYDLWILPVEEQGEPRRLSETPGKQSRPSISPDLRRVAYASDESGRDEVYVCSIEHPAQKRLISVDGGSAPTWRGDGTELYYISTDDELIAVAIDGRGAAMRVGLPEVLFEAPLSVTSTAYNAVTKPRLVGLDGDRFLFQVPAEEAPPRTIKVVMNWERLTRP